MRQRRANGDANRRRRRSADATGKQAASRDTPARNAQRPGGWGGGNLLLQPGAQRRHEFGVRLIRARGRRTEERRSLIGARLFRCQFAGAGWSLILAELLDMLV